MSPIYRVLAAILALSFSAMQGAAQASDAPMDLFIECTNCSEPEARQAAIAQGARGINMLVGDRHSGSLAYYEFTDFIDGGFPTDAREIKVPAGRQQEWETAQKVLAAAAKMQASAWKMRASAWKMRGGHELKVNSAYEMPGYSAAAFHISKQLQASDWYQSGIGKLLPEVTFPYKPWMEEHLEVKTDVEFADGSTATFELRYMYSFDPEFHVTFELLRSSLRDADGNVVPSQPQDYGQQTGWLGPDSMDGWISLAERMEVIVIEIGERPQSDVEGRSRFSCNKDGSRCRLVHPLKN